MWTRLRAEARVEAPGWKPFWAVTKHADVTEVASQPLRFFAGWRKRASRRAR